VNNEVRAADTRQTVTRRDLVILVALWIASRLLLTGFGTAALTWLPSLSPEDGYTIVHLRDGGAALDMWYRWDAGFYTSIATYGYTWQNEDRPADDMAFMPLYPLLTRAVSGLTADGCALSPYWSTCTTLGGLLVSNAALLGALVCLFWLTAARHDKPTTWRAALLLMVSPIGIFLSGVYTESLFLLLSLLVFVCLERRQFAFAVIAAIAASLTRSVGIALVGALLWHVWATRPDRRIDVKTLLRFSLALLPGVAFAVYIFGMGISVGDPLAYFNTYELTWNRAAGTPVEAFTAYFSGQRVSWYGWTLSWLDLILTLFYLALPIGIIIRERGARRGDGLYALGALVIPITSGTLVGMPRFGAVLFPFYIVLARWADRPWRMLLVYGLSAALAALFALRFVTGRWIA